MHAVHQYDTCQICLTINLMAGAGGDPASCFRRVKRMFVASRANLRTKVRVLGGTLSTHFPRTFWHRSESFHLRGAAVPGGRLNMASLSRLTIAIPSMSPEAQLDILTTRSMIRRQKRTSGISSLQKKSFKLDCRKLTSTSRITDLSVSPLERQAVRHFSSTIA